MALATITQRIKLHRAQLAFRRSDALYRAFCGGVGAGKSFVGALDLLKRARKGCLYMAAAPTFPLMRDSTLRSFLGLAGQYRYLREFHRSEMRAVLGNRAEVLFRSADDPEKMRGTNLSGAFLDEASLMDKAAFDITIGRLREGGRQGWLTSCFTPRGRAHWSYEVFGTGRPDVALFHARTADNPFLPARFADTLARQYTSRQAQQELGGEFTDPEGSLFRREWFALLDAAPPCVRRVRWWDLAATAPGAGSDPDYTAGVLVGKTADGRYPVLDVRRARLSPAGVERLVLATAQQDGRAVEVWMEQEPGSAGASTIDHYARRVLAGFTFRGLKPTGDKAERARPLASMAEAGHVPLVRGPWNKDTLDELETFPRGAHDDVVDATAGAFLRLASSVPPGAPSGGGRVLPRGPEDGPGVWR
jgi:predicted phage terminase large subunit-like protein